MKREIAVPVAEAARDFLKLLDRVEREHASAVLVRDGKPVAPLSPVLRGVEQAERWPELDRLPAGEAHAFADDFESGRRNLPPLKTAWDCSSTPRS